jgi:hypothetical protein
VNNLEELIKIEFLNKEFNMNFNIIDINKSESIKNVINTKEYEKILDECYKNKGIPYLIYVYIGIFFINFKMILKNFICLKNFLVDFTLYVVKI